ncbi:CPBP family intramembrane glutamic endopeptidase [Subtercola endophyticus]|uniref:CPBP family intramembrane glutamic endopeptidase n=1 Tax=Subtercola endophyticus TaxID=2895559 RepID=UPI001E601F29|nr:CPBP family intramembrane glutamic endopeptidase [Subtercola endophyticus]UFS58822.1 hypothetical protein LQ955_17780 [Subtercola endophyticus]
MTEKRDLHRDDRFGRQLERRDARDFPFYNGQPVEVATWKWMGIGVARLVLTLAFIRTKNILVSTGAHILNDWGGFTFALLTGLAAAGATR